MRTFGQLVLLLARLLLLASFATSEFYLAHWARVNAARIHEGNHKRWLRMVGILSKVLLVDSLFAVLDSLFFVSSSGESSSTEWAILASMLGMIVHLLARLGLNCMVALQARHFALLRGNLQREEWRSVIGLGIFSTVSDVSLRFAEGLSLDTTGSPVRVLRGNWYAMLACSTTYYAYLLVVAWQTGRRVRQHYALINTKLHRSPLNDDAEDAGPRRRVPAGHVEEDVEKKIARYTALLSYNTATMLYLAGCYASIVVMALMLAFASKLRLPILEGWLLCLEKLQALLFVLLSWANASAVLPRIA